MQGLFHHDIQPQNHVSGNHVHYQHPGNQRYSTGAVDAHLTNSQSLYLQPGLILGLCPANERRRYFVTTSLIGSVQA